MLTVRHYPLGPIQTNCYLVINDKKECLIFDPGEEGARLEKEIQRLQLTPKAILLTHAHFDHIGAVDRIRDSYDIPVWIHERESNWLSNPEYNGSKKYDFLPDLNVRKADHLIRKEGNMEIEGFEFIVSHTPGHSPGSICYIFPNDHFAIVGDTLFKGSIGRTDLQDGNEEQLLKSIRSKLLTLPEDTILYPGHGDWTTPRDESKTNPYL